MSLFFFCWEKVINKCCYNILVITQNGKYNIGVSFYQNFKYYNFIRKTKMDKIIVVIIISTHFTPNLYYYFPPPPSLLPFTVTVLSIFPFNRSQTRKAILSSNALFPLYLIILQTTFTLQLFFSLKSLLSLFILNLILRALFIYWIFYRFQFITTVTQEVSSFFFYVFFRVQYARETEIFVRFETDRKLAGDLMESTSSVFHCLSFHGANCSANFMFELQALVRCCCWGETMLVYAFSACIIISF